MAKSIATVYGTALEPGVSRNGRLYTREAIAKAVKRAQSRIAEGELQVKLDDDPHPLTQRTHHASNDDTTRVIGRITSLTFEDDTGKAKFVADIANTPHGRTIANLVDTSGGKPFVRGVSIRGAWVGKVRREKGPDGAALETADDLELHGLDYTAQPGVVGAVIDDVQMHHVNPSETSGDRVLIYESAPEVLVTFTEQTDPDPVAPVGEADAQATGTSGPYADPGYQADKKKRYPLDSRAHAKSAWSFINQADNAKLYTSAQLKRIKGRIKSALKKFGVTVTAEAWLIDSIAEAVPGATLAEDYSGMYRGESGGSFCLNATNGPTTVTVSSYCVDPADLELVLHAAVDGAAKALQSLDPDMDADIDVPGADDEDTDDDMESAPADGDALAESAETTEPAAETPSTPEIPAELDAPAGAPEDPAPEAAADQPETEVPAMAEPTTAVEPTQAATPAQTPAVAPAVSMSAEQFEQLLAKLTAPAPAMAAAESAPEAEKVEETKAPARTLTDADIAALAAAIHPPVAETVQPDAKPVEETKAEPVAEASTAAQQAVDVQKAVAEGVKAAIPQILENFGIPQRRGYRTVSESDGSGKELSAQDLWDRRGDVWKDMIPDAPATVQPQPVQ